MELKDVLYQMMEENRSAAQPTDLKTGTVTSVNPLEITINAAMQPLKSPILYLTESVVEKKITAFGHTHNTTHVHGIQDTYTGGGSCSPAGSCTEELTDIVCVEHGKTLPAENGYVTLNRGLAVGDQVLLLRVQNGQKFIVLSRVFEGG